MNTIDPPLEINSVGGKCRDKRSRLPASISTTMPLICGLGIIGLALFLRGWNISAPYQSADQATMDYFVRHNFGIRWIFEHSYGPISPLIHRCWAELCWRIGVPIHEGTARLPSLFIGMVQVAVTFPLLRRLGSSTNGALGGMLCVALLSTCVVDTRQMWAWGYLSLWLLSGTVAFWATLAYLQDQRNWQLMTAGGALLVHCLSNVYAFALPATLLAIWATVVHKGRRTNGLAATRSIKAVAIGFVLPCMAALAIIAICWMWTGSGQIGHLLAKKQMGTAGLHWDQLAGLPSMWFSQFGYLFGLISAAGLFLGGILLAGNQRWLALWAWLSLLPILLMADWDCIGYARAYFIEPVYVSAILGILLVEHLLHLWHKRTLWRKVVMVLAGLALLHMGVGVGDDMLNSGRLYHLTGLANHSDEFRHDTGAKAAGWYVRRYVPEDAVVMAVHTNKGMEVVVAELYLGRKVLAGWDHKPAMIPPLVQAMAKDVDVFIVEPEHGALIETLPDFKQVCSYWDHGQEVRVIHARSTLDLPRLEQDVSGINVQYDRLFQPHRVPIPLPATDRFRHALTLYQQMEQDLRHQYSRRMQLSGMEN